MLIEVHHCHKCGIKQEFVKEPIQFGSTYFARWAKVTVFRSGFDDDSKEVWLCPTCHEYGTERGKD